MGDSLITETSGSKAKGASTGASGFSPIELLMAATLLGIVIATLVPRMLSASEEARRNSLLHRLHLVRGQIDQFRKDHDGRLPAAGKNSTADFIRDLNSRSNRTGRVSAGDSSRTSEQSQMPPLNPYTQKSEILVVPDHLEDHHYSGSGRHGWAYSSTTGEFRSNLSPNIVDGSGRLINQL